MLHFLRCTTMLGLMMAVSVFLSLDAADRANAAGVRGTPVRGKSGEGKPASRPAVAVTRPSGLSTRPVSTRPALATQPSSSKVIVYYFHRTIRCQTCLRMEELARQAVQNEFSGELDFGGVEWRPLDFQRKGNERFQKEFDLSGPALVLVRMVDGKPSDRENLEEIWDLVGKPADFMNYVQDGLRAFVQGETGGKHTRRVKP